MNTIGVMHNAYAVVIAIGIAIFDILPVAGSGGILIPWALISLLVGNTKQGIGLLVLYVVITVIRQYIEPKIVGQTLGVNSAGDPNGSVFWSEDLWIYRYVLSTVGGDDR